MSIHGAAIELTEGAKELLVEQGYDPAMGARPLRRSIQRLIEDPLADFVLGRDLKEGSTILIDRRAEPGPDDSLVDITIVEGAAPEPEKVTVPPEEPEPGSDDEPAVS
jgi:ATP-dependent Clp protease ATP-binding subunit ClpC